jgi:phosphomannomutase
MSISVKINPTIFREYDIRGIVNEDLTPEVLNVLGRAYGTFIRSRLGRPARVTVGRDVRASSQTFAAALSDGLRSTGCNVIDIGAVPTPVMYFSVAAVDADGGLEVTASHNPPEFNGLKLRWREGQTSIPLSPDEVQRLRQIAESGDFATGNGGYSTYDVLPEYVDYVRNKVHLERKLRVVLDGGNGVAGPAAQTIMQELGCEIIPLYIEPDSTFPHHIPNPLKPENMQDLIAKVKETKADIGIALDGDGDRCGVVDNDGAILWPDQYLIPLERHVLRRGSAPIVFDVKASMALIEDIQAHSGTPVMWKTGYPNISRKRKEVGAPLAGEFSGHVFFNDPRIDFDDGIFTACHVLEYLSHQQESLSGIMASAPRYFATPEQRIYCPDTEKFRIVDDVRRHFSQHYHVIDIDGARIDFGDGWGLVRASNTEPNLTMRFEAKTPERMEEIRSIILKQLAQYPELDVNHIL